MIRPFPQPSSATEAPKTGSGRKIDPVGGILRHWKAGFCLFLVILTLGAPFAWLKGTSKYRTEGVIYVSPRFQRNLDTDPEHELQSNTQYREFVQQQVKTMTRFDIVQQALHNLPPSVKWKKKGETERRAVDRLRSSLEVLPVADTYQVTVGLSSEEADGLTEIINSVMQSYVSRMRTELMFDGDSRLQHLEDERKSIEQQIADMIGKRSEIAQKLGTTVFTESMVNSYEKMLGSTSESLVEARHQRLLAEAGVTAKDRSEQPGEGSQAEALEKALSDTGLASLKGVLNQRKAEIMIRITGLSAQHISRIAGEKEIQQIDREIEQMTQALRERLAVNLEALRRAKLGEAEKLERQFREDNVKVRSQAEEYSRAYQQSLEIGAEVERHRKRLTAIEDRISYLRMESQAPGWVRVFSPAMKPDLPFQGGRKKLFVMVFGAAVFLSLALPIGLDFMDPKVRAGRELEFQVGLPVTACLPQSDADPVFLDRDAMVRASVTIRRHLPELRFQALVITALGHGGGSTSFTLALAVAMNRLGVKTLVIEANPQTPDVRYLKPGRSTDQNVTGLIQWLDGDAEFRDCLLSAEGELPDRLGTGIGIVENLLPVERVLGEIALLPYDFVLIDASPVKTSIATEEFIRVIGSVVVVADAQKDNKADVKAFMSQLERLAPEAFGAVLNKIAPGPKLSLKRLKSNGSSHVLAA